MNPVLAAALIFGSSWLQAGQLDAAWQPGDHSPQLSLKATLPADRSASADWHPYALYGPAMEPPPARFFLVRDGDQLQSLRVRDAGMDGLMTDSDGTYVVSGSRSAPKTRPLGEALPPIACGVAGPDPISASAGLSSLRLKATVSEFDALPIVMLAFEYDAEFLAGFGNHAAVQDWIEQVAVHLNAVFPDNLGVRVMIAAIVQPDHARFGDDDLTNDRRSLSQAAAHWETFHESIDRTFTVFLSARNVGAGVPLAGNAFVGGTAPYCDPFSGSSINVINTNVTPAAGARLIGHELGHNLGARHTHCERLAGGGTAFVDECFNRERFCHEGFPACPDGGCGTLMSYCHFPVEFGGPPPPCDVCLDPIRFHPLIAAKIGSFIADQSPPMGSCLKSAPLALAGEVSVDGNGGEIVLRAIDGGGVDNEIIVGSAPENGSTTTPDPPKIADNQFSSRLIYTPAQGFEGDDELTFIASNEFGATSAPVRISVAVFASGFENEEASP